MTGRFNWNRPRDQRQGKRTEDVNGNYKPALKNVDDAVKRRLSIIPFLHQPAQPDR